MKKFSGVFMTLVLLLASAPAWVMAADEDTDVYLSEVFIALYSEVFLGNESCQVYDAEDNCITEEFVEEYAESYESFDFQALAKAVADNGYLVKYAGLPSDGEDFPSDLFLALYTEVFEGNEGYQVYDADGSCITEEFLAECAASYMDADFETIAEAVADNGYILYCEESPWRAAEAPSLQFIVLYTELFEGNEGYQVYDADGNCITKEFVEQYAESYDSGDFQTIADAVADNGYMLQFAELPEGFGLE